MTESETIKLKKSLADLRRGGISRRRNPLIAELLRRIHLVEAWGRGMPLILKNAPSVTFREVAGLFIASFERSSMTNVSPSEEAESLPTSDLLPEAPQETPKKHQRNAKELLLQHLEQHPFSSIRSLAETLGMTDNSVRHHLRTLQANNRIRHVGPTKGGHWEVIPPEDPHHE